MLLLNAFIVTLTPTPNLGEPLFRPRTSAQPAAPYTRPSTSSRLFFLKPLLCFKSSGPGDTRDACALGKVGGVLRQRKEELENLKRGGERSRGGGGRAGWGPAGTRSLRRRADAMTPWPVCFGVCVCVSVRAPSACVFVYRRSRRSRMLRTV